ncbi:hypothetical protein E2542_SST06942 [Spatholobus suberectus]|nr:hypothetical protein E2542_SST06942 [Spatholobus suberectus]
MSYLHLHHFRFYEDDLLSLRLLQWRCTFTRFCKWRIGGTRQRPLGLFIGWSFAIYPSNGPKWAWGPIAFHVDVDVEASKLHTLGKDQGGQLGAARYFVIFIVVGTTDFAILQFKDALRDHSKTIYQDIENSKKNGAWLKSLYLFPIQVRDEEAPTCKMSLGKTVPCIGSLREDES